MESKHIVEVEEQDGPVTEVIVAKHEELERLYLTWAQERVKLVLAQSNPGPAGEPTQNAESLEDSVSRKFETFLAAFELQLPEIFKMLIENQQRSMFLSIRGVDKASLTRIVIIANKHKLHGILIGDQIEFVTLNRINGNEIKLDELPDIVYQDLDAPEATQPETAVTEPSAQVRAHKKPKFYITAGNKKISKTLVKSFRDVPDPVTEVQIIEILPLLSQLRVRVIAPATYGCPITSYHFKIVIQTREGAKEETSSDTQAGHTQIPAAGEASEHLLDAPSLSAAASLTVQVFASNSSGRQQYSGYFRFRLCSTNPDSIRMLGRNELNQIDPKVVDPAAREVIEGSIADPALEGYCDIWASVGFEGLGVKGLKPVQVVSRLTTLAVVNNAQLVQWGNSLSLIEGKLETVPASPFLRKGLLVQSVTVGGSFCAALTVSGQIYTWGNNIWGQLGLGKFNEGEVQPSRVTGVLEQKIVTAIEAGEDHMICLTEQGIAYSWGKKMALTGEGVKNRFGDWIGLCNLATHQCSPQDISSAYIDKSDSVAQIASGDDNLGFLTQNKALYLWGDNDDHILGLDYPAPQSPIPIRYPFSSELRPESFKIGLNHVAVLATSKITGAEEPNQAALYCWGNNGNGQCGTQNLKSEAVTTPVKVEGLSGRHISFFSCGTDRTFVITDKPESAVFVFGRKLRGVTDQDYYAPHKLPQTGSTITEGYDTVVLTG